MIGKPPRRTASGGAPCAVDRRAFLAGILGLGTCVLAGCAAVTAVRVAPVGGTVKLRVPDHPGLAGPGGWLRVDPGPGRETFYVLVDRHGAYHALSPLCTHQGCTVGVEGEVLVCPCHGSTYDRSGRVLRGPAERPLRRYPTARDGDAVLIGLEGS